MSKESLVYSTLRQAARSALDQGHPAEAQAIFSRAAKLIKAVVGEQSLEYASCLHELGDASVDANAWELADVSYRAALEIYLKMHRERSVSTIIVLRSLADVCRHNGAIEEAERLEQQAGEYLSGHLKDSL